MKPFPHSRPMTATFTFAPPPCPHASVRPTGAAAFLEKCLQTTLHSAPARSTALPAVECIPQFYFLLPAVDRRMRNLPIAVEKRRERAKKTTVHEMKVKARKGTVIKASVARNYLNGISTMTSAPRSNIVKERRVARQGEVGGVSYLLSLPSHEPF